MPSLLDFVIDHATDDPDRVAVTGPDTSLTYRQLQDAALAYGGMLREKGVVQGDRVLFIAPTVPEFVVAYLGVHAVGGVVVPVNPLCMPPELAYFIEDAEATLVIAWDTLSDAARTAAQEAGIPFLALAPGAVADGGSPLEKPVDFDTDDLAVLLYTSGTTGRPKGAELTRGNLSSAAGISLRLGGATAQDKHATALPLFHVFGQVSVMLSTLHGGARLILVPKFTAEGLIDVIVRDKVTILSGVPTMWNAMLHASPETGSDSFESLRILVSGGASLPLEINRAFRERFGCEISEGYGLTETVALATFSRPGEPAPTGTVGRAVYGCEVEVRDDDGNSVPTGERGTVFVKGPVVMRGYWHRPDATAETIRDGWLDTGDIGQLDADGNLTIVDRAKELIIRGGYNVYPSEVEGALYEHPDIVEAAVLGLPDERMGEEIVAVVAARPGAELTVDDVRGWTADRLASYKLPRGVAFVEALPKGASGKIQKIAIDQALLQTALADYRASRTN